MINVGNSRLGQGELKEGVVDNGEDIRRELMTMGWDRVRKIGKLEQ